MNSHRSPARLGLVARLILGFLFSGDLHAENTPPQSSVENKAHVLFVGADISVEKDKKMYPVEDVAGDAFIVKMGKDPVRISTEGGPIAIKVDQHLQLTNRKATLQNLKGDRVYSIGGDPQRRNALHAVEVAATMQEGVEHARIQTQISEVKLIHALRIPGDDQGAAEIVAAAKEGLRKAQESESSMAAIASSDFARGTEHMRMAEAERERELFDAIEITFSVSSAEHLADAYIVVIARIRDPESKPGSVRNWIYAKSIGDVTESPRSIHIKHAGFTPGYILEGYDVHLYDHGREVATNVSPKRVELSKEDAAQYALVEYVTANKGATLPPAPALGTLPPDYHEHLGGPNPVKVCYVKVNREGVPTEVYLDESCATKLEDSYLDRVLRAIWFKPALEKGKPTEGVARVKLASLRM